MTHNTHKGHWGQAKTLARKARNSEFLEMFSGVFRLMIDRKVQHPFRKAVAFTLNNGTPRYHVSFERAYEVVAHILRTGMSPLRPSHQTAMWMEIAERVRQLMAASGKMSIAQAVEWVLLNCRATRFFMSEEYACKQVREARRERRLSLQRLTRTA